MTAADGVRAVLVAKADALVRRSAENLAALIHPDFVYVNAAGRMFGKDDYVDFFCRSGKIVFVEQRFSELLVRPFDGFAVATLLAHDRFVVDGREVGATFQSLNVFARVGDGWQWAAGQTKTP